MNVYNFKKIEKCYVYGNIDRNMDRFIKNLTSNVSKFKKEEHPKEIERQERLKKRSEEMCLGIRDIGHPNPHVGAQGNYLRRANRRNDMQIEEPGTLTASFDDWAREKVMYGKSANVDSTYNDSVIIVSGNCGIGNKSKKYYEDTFGKLDKVLGDNNCFILFVRGNNDNPSIFNNREIDFEHIKTIPDYSVVCLKTFNCLCIGGSVSMDKEWKLAQEELYGKKLFYEDEAPQYDENKLNEILDAYNINCVITSTCPSFAYPGTNAFKKSKWFYRDKNIINEFSNERKIMDRIYEKIMDSESKPYMWIYGRFKISRTDKINDIVFTSLASYAMIQINSQLSAFFGIDTSKTLENNGHTFDHIIADDGLNKKAYDFELEEEDAFEGEEEGVYEAEDEPTEEVETTTATTITTRELDRMESMLQDITMVENRAASGGRHYIYEPINPIEMRAITLEDIERATTLVRNGTLNHG